MSEHTSATGEVLAPPAPPGPIAWLKKNLFSGWFNSLLTMFSLVLLYFAVVTTVRWVVFTADWRPITHAPLLFLVGQYPREELWRVGVSLLLMTFLIGLSWGQWERFIKPFAVFLTGLLFLLAVFPLEAQTVTLNVRLVMAGSGLLVLVGSRIGRLPVFKGRNLVLLWVLSAMAVALVILPGMEGSAILPRVATTAWGGLMVTLLLAVGGIVLSFPIGVLLALGRRSSLPVVKAFSIVFIETIRGVPLVTVLFMFSVILALFLPPESRIDRVLRALMAMVFFSAAYSAENVRGGLQAIPQGQSEAAKALGLNNFQTTFLIVLPQAIRKVIPAIVGQFISLFKDTTLVVIVGINDLLGIGNAVLNLDPEFVRLQMEVYLFIAIIFWIFSYFMSYTSQELEKALGVGGR